MMQYKHLTTSLCTLALAFGPLAASAAELGDVVMRSYIGQPLALDIDLVSLTPEEEAGLQVRLARPDVYRGANVTMNPALGSVRMQVERRGARQVLHVTTTRPVEADYLHLYVELGVPGKPEVRLATAWLQRDPNPPPPPPVVAAPVTPPVPLASAMTPAQAEQIAAQARAARAAAAATSTTQAPAAASSAASSPSAGAASTATSAAAPAAPVRDRTKPAPLPSMHEAQTGVPGEIKAAAGARRIAGVLVSADGKPIKPSAKEETHEVPVGVAQALLPLGPLPLPKGVKRPAPASCAPTGMSAKECVALDRHNAELSGKITELEARLKAVQGVLGAAAPAKGSAAKAHGPASASVSAPAKDHAPAKEAPAEAAKESAPAKAAASGGKGAASAMASASLSAQGATEVHAAKASSTEEAASAASAAASAAASVPTKQVRVLPKLKYKKEKEKQPEQASSNKLPLIAGGVGLLALLGAGLIFLSKKNSGRGPLKIWQGFRKKKAEVPKAEPVAEPAPETAAS